MSAMLLAQQILNGLLDGVYYLLIALGLSLIFSLGGIVNLAHGAFYAIGAYLTLVLSPYIGFGGSFVAAPIAVALLGVVIERTLFRRFYRSDPILSLLMTFGLALVAEQALRMIFGAPPLSYSIPTWLRGQVRRLETMAKSATINGDERGLVRTVLVAAEHEAEDGTSRGEDRTAVRARLDRAMRTALKSELQRQER